eukprot:CAMPEP_0179107146 /NCGR_PEP_ID=MMETSP0796-20121207/49855_1 /TAXON_ID=73915 /ORGANISM="Pyrodinium bahamense, Strain pbaha01" /LENGTH=525 /DNA_ID=CAMNT_0020805199 /DNA_START=8 /DNA_END=1582 /DNA_ORIENTATION=+
MAMPANGELNVEVSEQNGLGEDSMMTFIRMHLASIFQPFADRVDELRKQLEEFQATYAESESRTSAKLSDHAVRMKGLREELETVSQHVEEAQAEAAKVADLEVAVQRTQSEINALNDRQRAVQATAFELQHETKANAQQLTRVQAELALADSQIARNLDETAQRQHAELSAVGAVHQSTARTLETAVKFGEDTRQELQKIAAAAERRARADEAALAQLRTTLASLETSLGTTEHRLQEQVEKLKAAKAQSATLQTRVEQTARSQTVLETRQKDTADDVAGVKRHLADVDEQLGRLSEVVGAGDDGAGGRLEEELQKLGGLFGAMRQLSERLDGTVATVSGLDRTTQLQDERLSAGETRAARLEASGAKLHQDAIDQLDKRTSKRFSGMEGLLGQQEHSQKQERDRASAEHAAFQKAVFDRLDTQARDIARAHDGLTQNTRRLEVAGGRLENLQGDLTLTNDSLTKLRSTMDLTQEYWKGLTKGLRQTHRSIAVDNELFSGREGHATTLPALTKTVSPQSSPSIT